MRATVPLAFAMLAAGAIAAFAQTADPAKKAKFIAVLERYDCRMHNFSPPAEQVNSLFASGLTREDLPVIARALFASNEAVRDGDVMVLKTGSCK